ncbi:hypothetical protein KAH81_08720 [bacterium]|nr:hypothetical protein [bacterium]
MKYLFLFIMLLLIFIACEAPKQSPLDTVKANYMAMQNEDIEAYLKTVSGPRAYVAGTLLVKFFEDYNVDYNIDTIELLGEISDVAQVRTVVTATDRKGANEFHDNRMVAIHKLKFDAEGWRINLSEVEKPVFLDKTPVVADSVR